MNDYNFDALFKLYKRFLKDNDIYSRAIELHKASYYCKRRNLDLISALKKVSFEVWIQNSDVFCLWRGTREGEEFWWMKHVKWIIFLKTKYNGKIYINPFETYRSFKNTVLTDGIPNIVEIEGEMKEIEKMLKDIDANYEV